MRLPFHERIRLEEEVVWTETGFIMSYSEVGPYFIGHYVISDNTNVYVLKLQLSKYYPNEKPILTIIKPKILLIHNSNSLSVLNYIGTSHAFHVNGTDDERNIEICHTHNWDASKSCVSAIIKGFIWCEAYEYHTKSGLSIDNILTKAIRRTELCESLMNIPNYPELFNNLELPT